MKSEVEKIDLSKTLGMSAFVGIPIKMIVAPADGIRKVGIEQLAESIKAVGLINALTVKNIGKHKYEIVAGRRRYWACLAAGIQNINCIRLNEDENKLADVIEVTENLHRIQLTPMQEAEAIQKLRDLKHSDESIAADLGMTRQFVARRAKLLNLSPEWKASLMGEKLKGSYVDSALVEHWPVACLELVARYSHERQKDIFEIFAQDYDIPDIDSLKRSLSHYEHKLLGAPWKLDDESLHPKAGACCNCPKRSGAQPLLFDDSSSAKKGNRNDSCLDPICWKEKLDRHTEIALAKIKTEHPDAIAVSSEVCYTNERGKRGLAKQDYEAVSKKIKGAKLAVFVDGPQVGKTLWIMQAGRVSTKDVTGKKKPLTDKGRAQRLRDRRNKWIVDTVRSRLTKSSKDWPVPSLKTIAAAVVTFGLGIHHYNYADRGGIEKEFKRFAERLKGSSDKELGETFWTNFRQDMQRKLCIVHTGIIASEVVPTMTPLFDMMGITFDELWEESAKEIPDRHNYLGENPSAQTPVKTVSSSVAKDKSPHKINEHGVFTNPQRINIPLPKGLKCTANIMLAKGSDGKWYHSHGFTHSSGLGGGGGLPSFNRKDGCKSREAAIISEKESLLAQMKNHMDTTGTGEDNKKRLRKAIEIVKGWAV